MAPKRVGFLGFDGVTALDLVGPLEAFSTAKVDRGDGDPRGYEVLIITESDETFASESGVAFKGHRILRRAPALDTLVIPGGAGLRRPETNARISTWIRRKAGGIRRIVSVCTGIYGLAPTGLLDGRRVTTHWRFADDVARRFPRLKVDPNALFLKDGPFYTSAGVTAGIDLALAMIEEDYGSAVALTVARELVMYLKRPGGQEQYSEPLRFQSHAQDRFGELVPWLLEHLQQDLSVEAMAERVCLSPRQFSRRFKKVFGRTPAAFVATMRLDEARRRLAAPDESLQRVGASVGFKSADVFRRAFERRFLVTPSVYRGRFDSASRRFLEKANGA
jgi:transcriptional regulator GlxA family with amidase domain